MLDLNAELWEFESADTRVSTMPSKKASCSESWLFKVVASVRLSKKAAVIDSASAIVMFSVKETAKALPAKEAKGVLAKAAIPNKVYPLKYLAEVITPFSEVVSVIFQVIIVVRLFLLESNLMQLVWLMQIV